MSYTTKELMKDALKLKKDISALDALLTKMVCSAKERAESKTKMKKVAA